jgi:hypothetical protein
MYEEYHFFTSTTTKRSFNSYKDQRSVPLSSTLFDPLEYIRQTFDYQFQKKYRPCQKPLIYFSQCVKLRDPWMTSITRKIWKYTTIKRGIFPLRGVETMRGRFVSRKRVRIENRK